MTNIINIHGGPAAGKSTTSSLMYYLLKSKNLNAELVREFVKGWAWQQRNIGPYDQFYFMGKQSHYESSLYGKVDWIVTDSPVLLCAVYAKRYNIPEIGKGISEAIRAFYKQASLDGHVHHHIVLKRTKPYIQSGRFETENQAKEIDGEAEAFLKEAGYDYELCHTDEFSIKAMIDKLILEAK